MSKITEEQIEKIVDKAVGKIIDRIQDIFIEACNKFKNVEMESLDMKEKDGEDIDTFIDGIKANRDKIEEVMRKIICEQRR